MKPKAERPKPCDVTLKLASALLRLAADKFSNHGCNDFDLKEFGLTEVECRDISEQMWRDNGSYEEEREFISDCGMVKDWCLMQCIAGLLDPAKKPVPEVTAMQVTAACSFCGREWQRGGLCTFCNSTVPL